MAQQLICLRLKSSCFGCVLQQLLLFIALGLFAFSALEESMLQVVDLTRETALGHMVLVVTTEPQAEVLLSRTLNGWLIPNPETTLLQLQRKRSIV